MPTPTRTSIAVLAVLSRASFAMAEAPAAPVPAPSSAAPSTVDASSSAPPPAAETSTARSVPEVPIVVQTSGDVPAIVDDAALREAIGRELRQPVLAPSARAPERSPRLVVTFGSDGTLRVAFRDASGREIARTVTRPTDAGSVVQLIALLAGNLARNEAGEIEAELMIREDGSPPPAQPPTGSPTIIVIQQPAVAPSITAPTATSAPTNDRTSNAASATRIDPLHAGRVYIHANAVGGVLIGSSYTFVGGGAGIGFRARHFALEVNGGFAELPWRPLGFASVLAFARFEAWRFEFAFGGGPTAMMSPSPTPQAGTGPYPGPPPPSSMDWGIGATAAARMSFALAGPLDLYAQAEASYVFDPGHTYSQAALAMFSGGLQARFAP